MQAIREKISDIRGARKVKADALHEEQQAALARAQEAHEARLIREAEIAMGIRTEEYIQHEAKLMTGDHKYIIGYGGTGLNNRHVADQGHSSPRGSYGSDHVSPRGSYGSDHVSPRGSYGGSTSRYSGGTYPTSPGHDSRKMAIHHKYL